MATHLIQDSCLVFAGSVTAWAAAIGLPKIREITEYVLRIEVADGTNTDTEIADQMLHRTNDGIMGPEKLYLVFNVRGILYGFVQCIFKVSHSTHRAHGIGLLEMAIFGGYDTANVFELGGNPAK